MENKLDVAVFVGSLRKDSFNRKIAGALARMSGPELALSCVDISALPLYDQDIDVPAPPPDSWLALRERVRKADAVLFITPEYNRSMPAVLKNVVDIASRPYGKNAWNGKPGAIISSSVGALGGFGANHHLRQSLTCLNVPLMQQPEMYVGNADKLFDPKGDFVAGSAEFFASFIKSYTIWVKRFLKS